MRPWYQKKRWWAVAIVVIVVIAAAAVAAGNKKTNAGAQPPPQPTTKPAARAPKRSATTTHPPQTAAHVVAAPPASTKPRAQPPTTPPPTPAPSTVPTPSAQADVRVTACTYDPATHLATAKLSIVNHSSVRSGYSIAVNFENSHNVQLGSTAVSGGGGVNPGKTSIVGALYPLSAVPDRVQCVVKSVDRFPTS
jgi:hypothetical protein